MAFLVNFKKFTRDISFCDNFARVDIEKKMYFGIANEENTLSTTQFFTDFCLNFPKLEDV